MSLHNPVHWPEILFERLRDRLSGLWRTEARLKGAVVSPSVRMIGRPILSVARESRLEIQARVQIRSALRSNPLGCFQPSVLRTLARGAELILERDAGISAAVICAGRSIRIGERTMAGAGALIVDNDFHRWADDGSWPPDSVNTARPIVIGRSVFIGARAMILKGVTIGDGAVVGAGAVVTRDVPAQHLATGNPAVIRPMSTKTNGA